MKENHKALLGAAGGAFAGGVAMKLVKHKLAPVAVLGLGLYLSSRKEKSAQNIGTGMVAIGAVGTIGKVAEKVEAIGKFAPQINGVGELYQDEDGNIIDLGGLNGQPQLVQDEYGNTYMVNGLYGDELADGEFSDYEDASDIPSVGGLEDMV